MNLKIFFKFLFTYHNKRSLSDEVFQFIIEARSNTKI
jgi:hypothetical protein